MDILKWQKDSHLYVPPSESYWIVLVLYSVEQSCNNETFQLCTKGEAFHLKFFFNRKKNRENGLTALENLNNSPCQDPYFVSFLWFQIWCVCVVLTMNAFNFSIQLVSSLSAQTDLHLLIGNYFSKCFLKTFFRMIVKHSAPS